ncbi:hypothetical protein OOT46_14920 [Aquabacterium sp. A7-Y]|uniref:hypothetical protein n=1 Tax=Aquabacterium sp. A7-Y TaxID=1349605 RepID=UPI00223DE60A|nr:hypothetical protein [Aquabacterium sp. A7-Y]MCW7539134.1 hypothetical protein [Aquabacterium sp. A7-Y]
MDPNHPLVQSVALPFAVALAAAGGLKAALPGTGPSRWPGAALGLALLVSVAWLLGWSRNPATLVEKLPWLLAAALLAGLLLDGLKAPGAAAMGVAALLWGGALVWMRGPSLGLGLAAWVLGLLVLMALAAAARDASCAAPGETTAPAGALAMVVVASLGVAALAMARDSLVLFQLGVLLAAASGGLALWLWPKQRLGLGASALLPAGLAWLALAWALLVLTAAPPWVLGVLTAGFAAAALVRRLRLPGPRAVVAPLATAALAALCAGAAVLLMPAAAGPAAPAGGDDAYYQPAW